MKKTYILLLIIVSSCLLFGQAADTSTIYSDLILDYDRCESYKDSLFDDPAMLQRFEDVILGATLDEIKLLGPSEQDKLFKFLYSRSNATENFLHGQDIYKIYPQEPICELMNRFVYYYDVRRIIRRYFPEKTNPKIDSIAFYVEVQYSTTFSKKQTLEIFEDSAGIASFVYKDVSHYNETETTTGKIEDWANLKQQLLQLDLKKIGLLNEQYYIRPCCPDGVSHSFKIKHNKEITQFSVSNLGNYSQVEPYIIMRKILALINNSLNIDIEDFK